MHRRRFLATTGAFVATSLAGCGGRHRPRAAGSSTSATADASIWPSGAHDAANSRFAPGSVAPTDRTVSWRATVERAEQFPPVVTESGVFVLGRGTLFAFDRDGSERWAVSLDEETDVFGAPTTRPGADWVALGDAGRGDDGGRLRLFAATDGRVVFERSFAQDVEAALVAPHRRRELYVATERGRVHALRRGTDGWESAWTHESFGGVERVPAVASRPVVATTAGVEGLTRGGLGRWRRGLPSPPVTRPVVSNDLVVVGCADTVVRALDADTGRLVWSRDVQRNRHIQERFGAVAVTPRRVFVTTSRTVWALDPRTGRPQWRYGDIDERFGRPVVVGDALLVTGERSLVAFERHGGPGVGSVRPAPVRWRMSLDVSPRGLAVAGDRAYLLAASEGEDVLLEIR